MKTLLVIAAAVHSFSLFACTGIKLIAKNGSSVHGRTMEFGVNLDPSLVVVPRNYAFKASTPLGSGLSYTSRYAALGIITGNQLAIIDGINEKGLSVGTFHFPGFAEYAQIDADNRCLAVSPVEFPHWILTQFATVEEVRAGIAQVLIAPTVMQPWGGSPAAFHYIVFDKAGKCLVIEPIKGQLAVYENKLGILTNAPTFNWHMHHLRQFMQCCSPQTKPLKLNAFELVPLGQKTEMQSIPGDLTPTSRFVRAALLCMQAQKAENLESAVYQAFHLLNQFDIPKGIALEESHTSIVCVRDPISLKYYFKTYDDPSIRLVDLNQFDWDDAFIKRLKTAETNQPSFAADISSELE